MTQGTLYGLGIGPGDPDLITLKALKILQSVPVIAYPAPLGEPSLARQIVASHIPDGREEIVIETPMLPGKFPSHETYDHYAGIIAGHLRNGQDVAVLCEGDPFFYGSFMYLYGLMAEKFECQVIPGVSSLMACATAAGKAMTSRLDVLSVIPAPLPAETLRAHLERSDACAIMKVGRHLPKVAGVLEDLGLADNAIYVERATMESEKVLSIADALKAETPYFSMILVHKRGEAWT